MKRINLLLGAVFLLLAFTGCKKDLDENDTRGYVTFWNSNSSIGNITVYLGDASGTITSNVVPLECQTSGCANFWAEPGTHTFTAEATTGETWSGSVDVEAGDCIMFHLNG